jgi:hypothetical protein
MALTIVTSGAQAVYDAGWPIIVGECGVGSRSNAADLAYLFDHAETNIWGWQGWALMYGISLSLLVSPGDIETDLTAWGQQVKDESQYLYGLSAPGVPPAPGTPPTIVVPASADTITNGITKTWTDISYDTTVTNATDKLEVEHAAAYGSVVFQKPAGALLDSGTYTTLRVLLNATTAQLQSLRGVLYRSHESGGEVQIMGEDTLLPYVSSLGDGWYIADIPVPAAGFESTSIAKVALQNVSSGPLAPYYIARTALLQDPSQAGLVMVTQPGASEVGQAVAGPPTVQANDQDGNPLAGVEVTVSLNKGTFLSGSVTTRLTDTNGIAVFDFLFIGVADTGYTLTFTAPGVA